VELLLEPRAWLLVVLLSGFGVVVALANYQIGKRGVDAARERIPQITEERWERVSALFGQRGSWVLILVAVPVVGIMLPFVAGALGIKRAAVALWVFIAKLLRNWLVVLIPVLLYRLLRGLLG
jgi:membrane protein YqaA with SNARE-associated domain